MRRNTWIQTGLAFTFASGLFVFSAAGRQPSTIDGATTPVEADRSTLNATEPLAKTLPPARRDSVEVTLIDRDGERIGTAYLTNDSMGVRIRTRATSRP